jgi:hypothetical protein
VRAILQLGWPHVDVMARVSDIREPDAAWKAFIQKALRPAGAYRIPVGSARYSLISVMKPY